VPVAARRILIVLLFMLFFSSLATLLVPAPDERTTTTTTTTTDTDTGAGAAPSGGELVKARIDAAVKRPRAIDIELGDQLSLRVDAKRPDQVAIPDLGLLEDVDPLSPARFDLFADRSGAFRVRLVDAKRTIGTIRVAGPDDL
jgi:hypothetical protein